MYTNVLHRVARRRVRWLYRLGRAVQGTAPRLLYCARRILSALLLSSATGSYAPASSRTALPAEDVSGAPESKTRVRTSAQQHL
jgi:hypothetical protein